MKKIAGLVILITFILSACGPPPEPEIFPVEVGDSCAGAGDLLDFERLYQGRRGTCGNYYWWTFIRFYEDCIYKSAASLYDTPRKNFLDKEHASVGEYSIEGSTLIMKSEVN